MNVLVCGTKWLQHLTALLCPGIFRSMKCSGPDQMNSRRWLVFYLRWLQFVCVPGDAANGRLCLCVLYGMCVCVCVCSFGANVGRCMRLVTSNEDLWDAIKSNCHNVRRSIDKWHSLVAQCVRACVSASSHCACVCECVSIFFRFSTTCASCKLSTSNRILSARCVHSSPPPIENRKFN